MQIWRGWRGLITRHPMLGLPTYYRGQMMNHITQLFINRGRGRAALRAFLLRRSLKEPLTSHGSAFVCERGVEYTILWKMASPRHDLDGKLSYKLIARTIFWLCLSSVVR